jgi:hypothetical protein
VDGRFVSNIAIDVPGVTPRGDFARVLFTYGTVLAREELDGAISAPSLMLALGFVLDNHPFARKSGIVRHLHRPFRWFPCHKIPWQCELGRQTEQRQRLQAEG